MFLNNILSPLVLSFMRSTTPFSIGVFLAKTFSTLGGLGFTIISTFLFKPLIFKMFFSSTILRSISPLPSTLVIRVSLISLLAKMALMASARC